MTDNDWVDLGLVGRPHGLRGWVHLYPHAQDLEVLLKHLEWRLTFATGKVAVYALDRGQVQGTGLLVHFVGCDDRDAAQLLTGAMAAVPRAALPAPEEGSFYWVDLIGLQAVTLDGAVLGTIIEMYDNGAHDIAILKSDTQTRQVPFIWEDTVHAIDWDARIATFDWPVEI